MSQKQVILRKTQSFFETYPILIFVQHNNLSIKEWAGVRRTVKSLKKSNVYNLKNSIASHCIDTAIIPHTSQSTFLFQGPVAVFGCGDQSDLGPLLAVVSKIPKMFVVGGTYNKEIYTHLDLRAFSKITPDVYLALLRILHSHRAFPRLLKQSTLLGILQTVPYSLIHTLSHIKSV